MKSGTSRAGARAAGSHTAALAGSEEAVEALFHQAGVLRATTLEELIDAAALLSTQPLPRGRRVAHPDECRRPRDPLLGRLRGGGPRALGALARDDLEARRAAPGRGEPGESGRHARLGDGGQLRGGRAHPPRRSPGRRTDRALRPAGDCRHRGRCGGYLASSGEPACRQARPGRPDQREEGVQQTPTSAALFTYPESAARALGLAVQRAEWLRRPAGTVPRVEGVDTARAHRVVEAALDDADDAWLTPQATRELLDSYGIPLVPELVRRLGRGRSRSREDARPAGRGQVGRGRSAQDGDRRSRAEPGRRGGGAGSRRRESALQ